MPATLRACDLVEIDRVSVIALILALALALHTRSEGWATAGLWPTWLGAESSEPHWLPVPEPIAPGLGDGDLERPRSFSGDLVPGRRPSFPSPGGSGGIIPCFGSGLDLGREARATVSIVSRISGPDELLVTVRKALPVEDTKCATSPSSSSSSGWRAAESLAVWPWSPRSLWSIVGPFGVSSPSSFFLSPSPSGSGASSPPSRPSGSGTSGAVAVDELGTSLSTCVGTCDVVVVDALGGEEDALGVGVDVGTTTGKGRNGRE